MFVFVDKLSAGKILIFNQWFCLNRISQHQFLDTSNCALNCTPLKINLFLLFEIEFSISGLNPKILLL